MTQYPQQPAPYQPQQPAPYQPYQPLFPQAPYQQPPPPPKKKHTVRNVLIVLGVLGILGVGGCTAFVAIVANEVNKQANEVHAVVYKVSGTSKAAAVLYTTDGKNATEQVPTTKLPWSKSLQIKGLAPRHQLLVRNGAGQTGTVSCSIAVDGKVMKTASAKGRGAIATCDYIP